MCKSVTDYNTLMRFLISVIVFEHFQRPSVVSNMTLEEFLRARKATDGRSIILVSDHKTGAQGPAQIALENDHMKLFTLYSKRSVAMQNSFKTSDCVCGIFQSSSS